MRRISILLSGIILFCSTQASALILFNGDNDDTTSDPGAGVPWNSVAKLTNATATQVAPSAIYLGDGYMLTARHFSLSGLTHVTFDGSATYAVDNTYTPTQVGSTDMQIFKLATQPSVAPVNLLTTPTELIANAVLVGWGVGRAPSEALGDTSVIWGDDSTATKRWGINVPRSVSPISAFGFNYTGIITALGSSSGTPAGAGAAEAAVTLYDSGSAMFQNISGTWYLIGLASFVETSGTSNFGNDAVPDATSDHNIFVRISSHSSQIQALIPEPGTCLSVLLGIAAFGMRRRRC